MATRLQSLLNFIFVFIILLFALAIVSPSQFNALMNIISQSRDLIIVAVVIGVIAYILKKVERI